MDPVAHPENWPYGTLISYTPGQSINDSIEIDGGCILTTIYPPTIKISTQPAGSDDPVLVMTQYRSVTGSSCIGYICLPIYVDSAMTLLDCTGREVDTVVRCPANQVPSKTSPWNNGCGCDGSSCIVDYSNPNSTCNCQGGGCGNGALRPNDETTCSTDCNGNPCGVPSCDGTCDTSNCDESCGGGGGGGCVSYAGQSCGSGVYDCNGNCDTSGGNPGEGGCGGNPYDGCGGCCPGSDCQEVHTDWGYDEPMCVGAADPILLDLSGNGFLMTDLDSGVKFDFYGDGKPFQVSWTAAGAQNAWLAIDLNHNGKIDGGQELFGNVTPQTGLAAGHLGFKALALYDTPRFGGNGDGVIDSKDAMFSRLLIWVDKNHNGVADPGELMTLKTAGIHSISVKYQNDSSFPDLHGNQFRYRAQVKWADPRKNARQQWAYDVVLVTGGAQAAAGK